METCGPAETNSGPRRWPALHHNARCSQPLRVKRTPNGSPYASPVAMASPFLEVGTRRTPSWRLNTHRKVPGTFARCHRHADTRNPSQVVFDSLSSSANLCWRFFPRVGGIFLLQVPTKSRKINPSLNPKFHANRRYVKWGFSPRMRRFPRSDLNEKYS